MSLLTFAKTALGSMVKQPVTVCYPQEKLAAPERLRGHIVNDMDVCICCGMCARRCPAGALAVDRKGGTWSIDPYACVVCGECIESCPKSAMATMSDTSSAVIHWWTCISLEIRGIMDKPPKLVKPILVKLQRS